MQRRNILVLCNLTSTARTPVRQAMKRGREHRWPGRVGRSCSPSDTRRGTLFICNKSWMKKGLDCYYDEWNMSMVICYTERTGLLLRRMEHVHGYYDEWKMSMVITTYGTCPWLLRRMEHVHGYLLHRNTIEVFEDNKRLTRSVVNRKRTDKTMAKGNRTKRQTTIYKTIHRN